MSIERLDVARLLAPDMRPLLTQPAMMHVLRRCGGTIVGDGQEWYAKIDGTLLMDADRSRLLNRALDLIAVRPDLWPPPSAA